MHAGTEEGAAARIQDNSIGGRQEARAPTISPLPQRSRKESK